MAAFLVLALSDSDEKVDAAVARKFPDDSYKIEPGKWMVGGGLTTTSQVYAALDLGEAGSHLILSIMGYYGRAQPDLWEWLAAQRGKADA